MNYSPYQLAFFQALRDTTKNIILDAKAGSGKTSTIIAALKEVYSPMDQICLIAFNKHIAEELQARSPANVKCTTMHALGNSILQRYQRRKVTAWKTSNILRELTSEEVYLRTRNWIARMVSLAKNYNLSVLTEENFNFLMDHHDIDDLKTEGVSLFLLCQQVLDKNNSWPEIDFDDMIYLPIQMNMEFPHFDVVMNDEVQDYNNLQMAFTTRLAAQGARVIAVGDPNQAIYGFRGANPEMMADMQEAFDATVMPLPVSYRCGQAIIREAQKIVPGILPWDQSPEGEVRYIRADKLTTTVSEGDYILCRCTAPLVSTCLSLWRDHRRASVKGKDLGEDLIKLVKKATEKEDIGEVVTELDTWWVKQRGIWAKQNKDQRIADYEDRIECILTIAETVSTKTELFSVINKLFEDSNDKGKIMLSTVHRAKGLETDNVFIIRPDLMPHPNAKMQWAIVQENNLKYVAITRAKKILTWVSK